jgi:serine/threonine protein phosphatase PrpC
MKIYSTLQLGAFHPIFCEDFLYSEQVNKDWIIAGVMDGCSSGKDSHFAATLFGKILKKIIKQLPYLELKNQALNLANISIENLSQEILRQLFSTIQKEKNNLFLEVEELVATCIISVYHVPTQSALITTSGDGVLAVNNELIMIEQNDKPDYLAYHLNQSFEEWSSQNTETHFFQDVTNLAISTDGVLSFAKNMTESVEGIDAPEFLMLNTDFQQQDNMLDRKCLYLQQEYELSPNDDVAIIRIL